MADVTITNLTAAPLHIGDLYATIPANTSITIQRYASDLSRMKALQAAVTAGEAAVSVSLSAAELASGLAVAEGSVQAADVQAVAASDLASASFEIRKSFTAAAAGAQDDVTIYAAGALPYKMRILDAYVLVSTVGTGAATLTVRDEAAGAGTAAAVFSSAATGRISPSSAFTATTLLTPGAAKGLFVRRADRDAAGEVVIIARRES
jgi:hypothetical protein